MADWSIIDCDYNCFNFFPHYQEKDPNAPAQCVQQFYNCPPPDMTLTLPPTPPCRQTQGENPRELRNKAEKQRRDNMNQSIRRLASIVPTAARQDRKLNRTSVLRLAAHYLRSHQHVFGRSLNRGPQFSVKFTETLLKNLQGFLITITYRGILVVVSPNIKEYLGYSELDLLGHNVSTIIHREDCEILADQLFPRSCALSSKGELLIPSEIDGEQKVAEDLAKERRSFVIRFKKYSQYKSEAPQYVACHVEGCLRKSDFAGVRLQQAIYSARRARSRGHSDSTCGNDVVFVGMVRPTVDTFITESTLEAFKMEYRTRHSIDGEIIQCEQRISLVTGYMTHEVYGVNAMNFMHRDDVRWVIIALREMYDEHRLVGESCYRLITKNGQFIYMRTLGHLDVDQHSNAVTSFVCTNTVVDEQEGKHLIKLMKDKFMLRTNIGVKLGEEEETSNENEKDTLPVEDPTLLEKVILHLVTDLPSPNPVGQNVLTQDNGDSSSLHLAIIPPRKEKIHEAIAKSYNIIRSCCSTMVATKGKENKKPSKSANVQQVSPTISQNDFSSEPSTSNTITSAVAGPSNMNLPGQSLQSLNNEPQPSCSHFESADSNKEETPTQELLKNNVPSTSFGTNVSRVPIPSTSGIKRRHEICNKTIKNYRIFKSKKNVKKYGFTREIEEMIERELITNLVLMQSYRLPAGEYLLNENGNDMEEIERIEKEDGISSRNYNEVFNSIIENFEEDTEEIVQGNFSCNDGSLAVFDFTSD